MVKARDVSPDDLDNIRELFYTREGNLYCRGKHGFKEKGEPLGSKTKGGGLCIWWGGKSWGVSRLIYFLHFGDWPYDKVVVHANKNPLDNRPDNLLLKTVGEGTAYKHGHRYGMEGKPTPEYHTWSGIKGRVLNKTDKLYPYYGGRGIKMDLRWHSFDAFLEDVGYKPDPDLSLDRIDNNKGYYKDNVRWATRAEQSRNKRSNIIVNWNGEPKCLTDVCTERGWRFKTVWQWYKRESKSFEWIEKRAEELWGKDRTLRE